MYKILLVFFFFFTLPAFALPTENDIKDIREEIEQCEKLFIENNPEPETLSQYNQSKDIQPEILDCFFNVGDKITALYYPDYKYIRHDIIQIIKYNNLIKGKDQFYQLTAQVRKLIPFLPNQLHSLKKIEMAQKEKNITFYNPIFSEILKQPNGKHGEKTLLSDKAISYFSPNLHFILNCQILENRLLYVKYICDSSEYKSNDLMIEGKGYKTLTRVFSVDWRMNYALGTSTQLDIPEELAVQFIHDIGFSLDETPFLGIFHVIKRPKD